MTGKMQVIVIAVVLVCCAYAAGQQLTAVHTFVCKNPQIEDPALRVVGLLLSSRDRMAISMARLKGSAEGALLQPGG